MSRQYITSWINTQDGVIKKLFEESFPGEKWDNVNNRYPYDAVTVLLVDNTPIGFVCYHNPSPFSHNDKSGQYLYNLCIVPGMRGKGHGTALLKSCMESYPVVQLHADLTKYKTGWLERLGFQRGKIMGRYIEYTHIQGEKNTEHSNSDIEKLTTSPHYDFVENIVYLDPLY